MTDREILRDLAKEYLEFALDPVQQERRKLHTAVNDLKMIRPVVMLDEIPWNEMNFNGELTLKIKSEDAYLRDVETRLRRSIFQQKYFPGDTIIRPYFGVDKIIDETFNGLSVEENIIVHEKGNYIVSHEFIDQFSKDEDLNKIVPQTFTYNETETKNREKLLNDIFGDILPVRIIGQDYFSVNTWDDITRYRGVTPLLMDLVMRPEFSHALVRKITDLYLSKLEQYEKIGAFNDDPISLHCTPILTSDLPKPAEGEPITRKNIWGRGEAQIFASVSKEMRNEFDIDYMIESIGTCGLSYYGCCEPLDDMIDIVSRIPNLRKVSITPWADVENAANNIGKKYVLSSKPTPASVAVAELDVKNLEKEISKILGAVSKHGCSCDMVLKDISTCCHNPQNIIKWEQTVMSMVK
jgi:hypothetical protein